MSVNEFEENPYTIIARLSAELETCKTVANRIIAQVKKERDRAKHEYSSGIVHRENLIQERDAAHTRITKLEEALKESCHCRPGGSMCRACRALAEQRE